MATTNIVDKDGKTINAADATVPSDRHFRGAWTLSGSTISEDITEAKKIKSAEKHQRNVEAASNLAKKNSEV